MSDMEDDGAFETEEQLGEEEEPTGEEEGAEDEDKQEEEEEKIEENPLTEEVVGESLSLLCKTGDGLAHAYVKLDVKDREVTEISILNSYIHIRYVDLSKNQISDLSPLASLSHLLVLKAENNRLQSAAIDELPYLQVASFANNRIKTTEGINHPLLEHLTLNFNDIRLVEGLNPSILTRLHTLELRGNKLTSTDGIYLPNLKNLFLGANTINKVEGLERLEHLATLHLRDNQIESLDGFSDSLRNLQYLNLKGNSISDIKELKKLQCVPMLRAVVFSDNAIADEDEYRMEVLISLRRIERLDKDEYTPEERQEAQDIYEQRRQTELAQKAEEHEEMIGSDNEGGE